MSNGAHWWCEIYSRSEWFADLGQLIPSSVLIDLVLFWPSVWMGVDLSSYVQAECFSSGELATWYRQLQYLDVHSTRYQYSQYESMVLMQPHEAHNHLLLYTSQTPRFEHQPWVRQTCCQRIQLRQLYFQPSEGKEPFSLPTDQAQEH